MWAKNLARVQKAEPSTAHQDVFDSLFLWLGVVCVGCAWTCLSGVYVSTYRLRTYESWFGYIWAAVGVAALIISLRKSEFKISRSYFWIAFPLAFYGGVMPYPYSVGAWLFLLGLLLLWFGRADSGVACVTPGILFSGLLWTLSSWLVPAWYYLACHERGMPWLASLLASLFTFMGTLCSTDNHTLFAQCAGDYRMIQVTVDAIGLLPGLFVLVGVTLCWLLRENGSIKSYLRIVVIWALYLLVRYAVFVWVFLGWADRTDISMMWDAVYCLISFLPLGVILTIFERRRSVVKDIPLRWEGLPTSMALWMMVVSGAIVTAIFGSALADPGHMNAGRVLIDESHSEWEETMRPFDTTWYGQHSTYNYYCLRTFLENFYEVKVNVEEITPKVLANQDVVVLKCPTRMYKEKEADALVAFVSNGGALFLIGDHTDVFGIATHLNAVAERFGLSFQKNGQYDIYGQFSVYKQPQTLGHPIGKHTPEFLFATGCTLSAPVWCEKPIIGYGMMTRLANYGNKNFFPEEAHYEDREFGLFIQLAGTFEGKGRILCFTDSTVWSNFSMFCQGKPELLLDCMMWLNRSNTWWASLKPWFLFASGLLLIAAIFISPSPRVLRRHHASLITCFATLIAISCISVNLIHGWAYKKPEARREFKKITFDCEHSDIFLANRLWSPGEGVRGPLGYGAFFVAAQRLAIVPQVRYRLAKSLEEDRAPLVFINPDEGFSERDLRSFQDYIAGGGKGLILDSSDRSNTSSAWQLIEPLSLEIFYAPSSSDATDPDKEQVIYAFSEERDDKRSISFPTRDICEIKGGEPRLWYRVKGGEEGSDEGAWKACLVEASYGSGTVWVCTLSKAFSNAGLGNSSSIPNRYQQNIYKLVFRALNDLVDN